MMASLVFDSTTSRSCVDFTALDDDVVEEPENLTAMLTSDDDVILAPDEATIVILDGGGTYEECVKLSGGREGGREGGRGGEGRGGEGREGGREGGAGGLVFNNQKHDGVNRFSNNHHQ